MSISKQNSKIIRNAGGEVLTDTVGSSSKILDINTNLQIPNKLFKDGANLVSQVTDHASGISFVQSDDAKKPVYNYDGYFDTLTTTNVKRLQANEKIALGSNFTFEIKVRVTTRSVLICQQLDWMIVVNPQGQIEFYDGTKFITFGNYNVIDTYSYIVSVKNGVMRGAANNLFWNWSQIPDSVNVPIANINNLRLFDLDGSSTYNFDGDLFYLRIYDNVKYPKLHDGSIVDGDYFKTDQQPFPLYKRYKEGGNKKLYLSSRYLKDAVINSSDEITSIKDEFGNTLIDAGTNKVKWTKKGLYFNQSILQRTGFEIGTNDFFIGLWLNNSNISDAIIFQNSGIIISKTSNNYVINGNTIGAFTTNTYEFPWVLRKSGVIYYGINGIQLGSEADTTNYTLSDLVIGGNTLVCYLDGVLLSIGDSIYNPTTWTSEPKKFEPPRRRGLESEIIQF